MPEEFNFQITNDLLEFEETFPLLILDLIVEGVGEKQLTYMGYPHPERNDSILFGQSLETAIILKGVCNVTFKRQPCLFYVGRGVPEKIADISRTIQFDVNIKGFMKQGDLIDIDNLHVKIKFPDYEIGFED